MLILNVNCLFIRLSFLFALNNSETRMKQFKDNKLRMTEAFREKILIYAVKRDIVSEVVEEALVPHTKTKPQNLQ